MLVPSEYICLVISVLSLYNILVLFFQLQTLHLRVSHYHCQPYLIQSRELRMQLTCVLLAHKYQYLQYNLDSQSLQTCPRAIRPLHKYLTSLPSSSPITNRFRSFKNCQNVQECERRNNLAYKYHMTRKHKALSEMATRDCTPAFNELNDGELRSIGCRVFH